MPEDGHRIGNGAAAGFAERRGVFFKAGRIDAQILAGPDVLRTGNASAVCCGFAQVRRLIATGPLRVAHVVFAPLEPRPLLLGLVRLHNTGGAPLVLDYTELWEVGAGKYRVAAAAAELRTPEGVRALAEASNAVRARPPEAAPARGLALDVRLALPPRAVRHLEFAYVAPAADELAPELLVSAYRGQVRAELARTAAWWRTRLAGARDPLADYARAVATLPA